MVHTLQSVFMNGTHTTVFMNGTHTTISVYEWYTHYNQCLGVVATKRALKNCAILIIRTETVRVSTLNGEFCILESTPDLSETLSNAA